MTFHRSKIIVILFFTFLLIPNISNGYDIIKKERYSLTLNGSYKNLLIKSKTLPTTLYTGEYYTSDLNRLTLDMDLTLGNSVLVKTIYNNEAITGSYLNTPEFNILKTIPEDTFYDAASTVSDKPNTYWSHSLYRFYLQHKTKYLTTIIGRQRIAWGQARIWNPTDLFNPQSPLVLESGRRTGVDSINLDYSPYAVTGINIVHGVFKNDDRLSELQRSTGVRLKTNIGSYDLSLIGGRFRDEVVIGADFAGNFGDSGFRGEWTHTDGINRDDQTRVVLSFDHNFKGNIYFLMEYLFNDGHLGYDKIKNSNPTTSTLSLVNFQNGEITTINKHFLALSVGYDITPLTRGSLTLLTDIDGSEVFASPSINYNLSENSEWIIGAQIASRGRGEYESLANSYFTSIELFF